MSFTELKRSEIKRYLLEKIDSEDPEFIAKPLTPSVSPSPV